MPEDFSRNAVMFWNFDPQIFLVLEKYFYNPGPGELFVTRLPGSGGVRTEEGAAQETRPVHKRREEKEITTRK